jgi:hypothetical protein
MASTAPERPAPKTIQSARCEQAANKDKQSDTKTAQQGMTAIIHDLRALTNNLCAYCDQPLTKKDGYDTVLPVHIDHGHKVSRMVRLLFLKLISDNNNVRACCVECNWKKGNLEKTGIFAFRSMWRNRSKFLPTQEQDSPPLFKQFTSTQFVFTPMQLPDEPGLKKAQQKTSGLHIEQEEKVALEQFISTFALRISCTERLDDKITLYVSYSDTLRSLLFCSRERLFSVPKHFGFTLLGWLEYVPALMHEGAKQEAYEKYQAKKLATPNAPEDNTSV